MKKRRINWFEALTSSMIFIAMVAMLSAMVFLMVVGVVHLTDCDKHEETVPTAEETIIDLGESTPIVEEPIPVVEVEPISLGEYKLTAYCACEKCCGKTDGITASGVKAVEGVTIAADTKVLPFGTEVIIDGHEYTVQDVGGAIKGNRIDIYFDSHQEALEFGVQHKEIFMKEGERV
jgi:3D (Asp-Asp-Asp) domain-containing protein